MYSEWAHCIVFCLSVILYVYNLTKIQTRQKVKFITMHYPFFQSNQIKYLYGLALLPPGALSDQMDSNPDSDSKQLDSDSRKKGWIRIQLDSDSRCLDSDPDRDSRCLDSHITDLYVYNLTKTQTRQKVILGNTPYMSVT